MKKLLIVLGLAFLPAAALHAQSLGFDGLAARIGDLSANLKDMSPEAMSSRLDTIAQDLSGKASVQSATVVAARRAVAKRKVYHVTYVRGVGWKIKFEGAKRASYVVRSTDQDLVVTPDGVSFAAPGRGSAWTTWGCMAAGISEGKDCAVARARELAKKAGLGQVIIHGMNGRIQTEYTYGRDPFPPKG